jgi:outer membrane biosynthesis protein TonB
VSGDRVVVRTAGFCWLIRQVPPGTRLPAAHESKREPVLLAARAVNGFLAVMIWVLAVTAPLPPEITMEEIGDQFVEVMLREAEPEPKKVVAVPTHEPEEKTEGAAAKRKSGKRGTQDGRLSRALEQRRSDRQIAEGAGFMGALNSDLGEMFSATGLGGGVVEALGRSTGPSGRQFGTGLGWDGDGPGGGGVAEGMPGGTGTKGHGGDRSSLSGGEPTGKKRTGNLAKGGQVIQIGNMDAALIDQVVKQHLNQYRYCYQRELQKDYGLSGKVTLKWIIASDGSVSSANVKRETIENSAVTRCMVNVARRMQFPQPKGGIVIVSYPFLFSPG